MRQYKNLHKPVKLGFTMAASDILLAPKLPFWRIRMFRLLKALPLALALAALTFFAASCGSSSTKYRVVDTIPDSPVGLDFDVNTRSYFPTSPSEA